MRYFQRIIRWFKDDVFRRLLVNAGWLLSSSSIAALLGFLTAFLAARGLQPAGYGELALVFVYVDTVGKLVSFQAWQAIIKFGSEALAAGDQKKFQQLIKFGFLLDGSSAILGALLAIGASSFLVAALNWDAALQPAIATYSWLILFSLGGTPIGLLRLFNRFDLLSYSGVATAVFRLIGVAWCWWTGQALMAYVWVFLLTGIAGQLYLLAMTYLQLRRRQLAGFLFAPLRGLRAQFPGIISYVWTTNLHATVKLLSRELDIFFIAWFSTPESVGVYKLAKQFARLLSTLMDPLYQSIFPELARLWSAHDRVKFVSLMKRSTLFVGSAAILSWVVFVVVGEWFIQVTVGPQFLDAYAIAIIYMLGSVIALLTFSFTPALLAIGLPVKSFLANLVATVFYFLALIPLLLALGVIGAALAYVVYYLVWTAVMLYLLLPYLKSPQPASYHENEI